MRISFQKRAQALCLLVFWSLSFCLAGNSFGQFRVAHVPDRLHTTQPASLFLDVYGNEFFDGALLAIPASWNLDGVSLISANGRASGVRFRTLEPWSNRYLILPSRRISAPDRLILTVRTGETTGTFRLRIAPVRAIPDAIQNQVKVLDQLALRADFRVDESHVFARNRVLDISARPSSPVTEVETVIEGDAPFTTEFWIKTVSRDAIVLSSWDGSEQSSYPVELLVDESGHAVFFRGGPGEHRSMRSVEPVADGDWHHVAVTHDEDERWSRMYIDGVPSDSIYHLSPLFISGSTKIALGGRPDASDDAKANTAPFSGQLDEIRLWNDALDAGTIRRNMRRPIPSGTGVLVVGFDDEGSIPADGADAVSANAVLSDLSFYEPISDFQVRLDVASVLLEWDALDPNVSAFLVERSANGVDFELLARIEKSARERSSLADQRSRFRDTHVSYGVTYYRIRQQFSDGMETVSRTLKVGMGTEEDRGSASLTGNFPNPFNPTTRVTYVLRESQQVQVSVWDLSGQMVTMLVDERQEAGEHQVLFEAKDLPSGTYFVRMRTADGIRSHQIILMK